MLVKSEVRLFLISLLGDCQMLLRLGGHGVLTTVKGNL